jgi:regulator of nucleoside diphosphate kinase
MKRPKIVITSTDVQRIEKLLSTLDHASFPNLDELESELDRADVVEPQKIPKNVVTMNSTVKFEVVSSGKVFSLTLVYPKDVDGSNNKISILAPVGSALLGLKEGNQIAWPKPGGGDLVVNILEVSYQPEREGNYHL